MDIARIISRKTNVAYANGNDNLYFLLIAVCHLYSKDAYEIAYKKIKKL